MKEFIIVLGMCVAGFTLVESVDYAALRAQHPWATAAQLDRLIELDSSHFGSRQATHSRGRGGCRTHHSGWTGWLKATEAVTQVEIKTRQQLACHRADPALPASEK